MKTAHRTCPICDAVCGLRLTLDDAGHVTSVKGDPDDPFSKGYVCPKGASLGALDEDPDRLRSPMIREGDRWREVSWEEAFQAVERGLTRVADAHGRQALAVYFGNPTFHTMAGPLYRGPLSQALDTPNIYSASTIDQMPKHVACGFMLGNPFAIAVPDLDRTDYLLVLGANPAESHGSLCAAPNFPGRLKALRARGGKLVVVDPRFTRTAGLADEHLFIRPGTDAYLLFGIVHTLVAEGLVSTNIEVGGLAELQELAADFAPEVVSARCGVPAGDIRRLARELAAAPTAAVYTRVGTCTSEFGTATQWLVDVINVLTGNFDRPGGVMFARTATIGPPNAGPFTTGRWHSRVRGLPEVLGELPVATLADEIETPGQGQVRALITVGGNLVLSAPNGPRLGRALRDLEFMVSVDPYLNETTSHADVILPPPRITQMPHYDFLLLSVTVRNYSRFSPAILPLEPDQLSEAEIMAKLALIAAGAGAGADPAVLDEQILAGLLQAAPLMGKDPVELRASLEGSPGPERLLDAMLKLGPFGLSLSDLLANPHGIDLGPLQPRLAELLATESGRVELAPLQLTRDVARLRARMGEPAPQMLLIGRRQLRSNNSWLHNVGALVGGSNRCTLHVNPADADRLNLRDRAVIRSATGELLVDVEATGAIMPGVVSLPHGWGHGGSTQRTAAAHAGVNANALTDELVVEALSGNAVFNAVPVTLAPWDGRPLEEVPAGDKTSAR
ncbi:molybdopterin-dependent oxidoreductase [Planobispora longispora]|uniref:Dehydrogenase n=1 Tax=Planobispora longispora TaxID=28887 RepID=A0A8J3W3J3_9ACTN|nr:molybdopterin-dependent oxidoreductase [Planobispora longispora]GIH75439.1 dehydrogenase [Planobispora longispora]